MAQSFVLHLIRMAGIREMPEMHPEIRRIFLILSSIELFVSSAERPFTRVHALCGPPYVIWMRPVAEPSQCLPIEICWLSWDVWFVLHRIVFHKTWHLHRLPLCCIMDPLPVSVVSNHSPAPTPDVGTTANEQSRNTGYLRDTQVC